MATYIKITTLDTGTIGRLEITGIGMGEAIQRVLEQPMLADETILLAGVTERVIYNNRTGITTVIIATEIGLESGGPLRRFDYGRVNRQWEPKS